MQLAEDELLIEPPALPDRHAADIEPVDLASRERLRDDQVLRGAGPENEASPTAKSDGRRSTAPRRGGPPSADVQADGVAGLDENDAAGERQLARALHAGPERGQQRSTKPLRRRSR